MLMFIDSSSFCSLQPELTDSISVVSFLSVHSLLFCLGFCLWIIRTVVWDSHIEDMPVSQPKALNCKRSWPLQLQLLVLSRGQIDKFIELYFCLSRDKVFQKLFTFKCNSLRPIFVSFFKFVWNVLWLFFHLGPIWNVYHGVIIWLLIFEVSCTYLLNCLHD